MRKGQKHSEETREKMRRAKEGIWSEERRAERSREYKKRSDEFRAYTIEYLINQPLRKEDSDK